jgi:cyanophycinase
MSETMLVTGPSRESHKIGESLQMAPGLGFIRDVIVDQHFTVIGAGAVYVADAGDVTYTNVAEEETSRALSLFNVRLHVLSQGDSYDLRTRQPTHQFAKKAEERLDRSEHRRKAPSPAESHAGSHLH